MTNLVIDIGNTLTKIAVFKQGELVHTDRYPIIEAEILLNVIHQYQVKKVIVSSVKGEIKTWREVLEGKVDLKYFDVKTSLGVQNHYKTPKTLGLDRWAAVVGAHCLCPDKANLIIDAGTCITYDWVDAEANYWGGSISPGLNMRYKALNYYTGALPLLTVDNQFNNAYGDDTTSAITSGVQNGIKNEVIGFIEHYIKLNPELNIVLTGGDSIFFDTLLKNSIFAPYIINEPYLVLKGLNAAIQNNND